MVFSNPVTGPRGNEAMKTILYCLMALGLVVLLLIGAYHAIIFLVGSGLVP